MSLPYTLADIRPILQHPNAGARVWSMHGIGMLRTYLDDARRWRLNVWHRALLNPGISTMHTHPWPFTSHILAGRIANRRYVRCTRKSVGAVLFNEGKITCGISNSPSTIFPGLNGEPEIITLHPNEAEIYAPGDTYFQAPSEIHDTRAADGTITVIERGDASDDCEASVFWPVGSPWGDASREFDTELSAFVLDETLKKLMGFAKPTGNWINGPGPGLRR